MRLRNRRRFRWPSLKRLLINLNKDLDRISKFVSPTIYEPKSAIFGYVLILEDRRFFKHCGFDYKSFLRNIINFLTFQKYGGSSTIEMQFVRTVTRNYDYTISRKLYEILLALLCRYHFDKQDILISYMSIAYLGTNYPVPYYPPEMANYEAVSNDRYGKMPEHLTDEEAAELASFLVYPIPRNESPEWKKRVNRRKEYALWLGNSKFKKRFYEE